MIMNLKRIIREEMDDFDWIKDIDTSKFRPEIGDLIEVRNKGSEEAYLNWLGDYADYWDDGFYGYNIEGEVIPPGDPSFKDKGFNLRETNTGDRIYFPHYEYMLELKEIGTPKGLDLEYWPISYKDKPKTIKLKEEDEFDWIRDINYDHDYKLSYKIIKPCATCNKKEWSMRISDDLVEALLHNLDYESPRPRPKDDLILYDDMTFIKNGMKLLMTVWFRKRGDGYWTVIGQGGDYGWGFSHLTQKHTYGKRARMQIYKQLMDKINELDLPVTNNLNESESLDWIKDEPGIEIGFCYKYDDESATILRIRADRKISKFPFSEFTDVESISELNPDEWEDTVVYSKNHKSGEIEFIRLERLIKNLTQGKYQLC